MFYKLIVFIVALNSSNATIVHTSVMAGDDDACNSAASYYVARYDPPQGYSVDWGCKPTIVHQKPMR